MKHTILILLLALLAQTSLLAQTRPSRPGSDPKITSANAAMAKAKTKPKDKKMGLSPVRHTEKVENTNVARAINTLEAGDVNTAIDQLDDYANSDTDAAYGLGLAYFQSGDTEKAMATLERATQLDNSNSDAWYELGLLYTEAGEYEKAEEAFLQILMENPEDADAWYELGFLYSMNPDLAEEAEACFSAVLMLNPSDPFAPFEMSRLLALKGDVDGALGKLEIALQNGFADVEVIQEDADLEAVRETDAFAALMEQYFPD